MTSVVSQQPFNDDFDAAKNFHQVLAVPGRPVQARELTTLQSILSNQIGVHARHIFKEGTQVIGGQLTTKRVTYVVVEDTYNSFPVVVEEFLDKKVLELDGADVETGYEGTVIKVKTEAGKKILFTDTKNLFAAGNKIKIDGENVYATVQERGFCYFLGVDNGIFFLRDRFVDVTRQSIILEDFNATPTGKAGLVWTEEVVTATEDNSLLDPARGTKNYGAAGAERLKISCVLSYVKEGDTEPANFSPLYEIRDGETKSSANGTVYSDLAKELARRTYDESGNYTVNPFALTLGDGMKYKIVTILTSGVIRTTVEHNLSVGSVITLEGAPENNGDAEVVEIIDANQFRIDKTFSASTNIPGLTYKKEDQFSIDLGKGKAYVRGFEIEKIASSEIPVNRARTRQSVENYNVVPVLGNYVVVTGLVGHLNTTNIPSVAVYEQNNAAGAAIGSVKVVFLRHHSGTKGDTAAKYRLYILGGTFNAGKSMENVRSFQSGAFVANVDPAAIITGKTQIVSSSNASLIYSIPQAGVATLAPEGTPSTSFTSHMNMSAAATGTTVQFTLGSGTTSTFYGPSGTNFAGTDTESTLYQFVNTTTNVVLNVSSIIISNNGKQLDVTFTTNGGSVSALVPVQTASAAPRTKTRATKTVNVAAGAITPANPIYSLATVDVIKINSIMMGTTDVKDRFVLDNGQRDTTYENASITLRAGATVSSSQALTVNIDYYVHAGNGYFSVDSYPDDYADIPTYTSTSGRTYQLSDVLDFRPSPTNTAIPLPNIPIASDYEFYLPRRDAVVLYSTGVFNVIEGASDINPQYPKIPEDAMVLYYLDVPPFTKTGLDVQTRYVDNKRYTMRDIGKLEKRIDRLEYYTALSLLEFDTKNTPIYDENGFERFKNGFLVDSFTGHGIGNVNNADYKCAVDPASNTLRPAFKSDNTKMSIASKTGLQSNDATKARIGEIITLPYSEETFLWNNIASKSESVTPFLVTDTVGSIVCNPPSDDWVDTTTSPALMVNLEGDLDAWEAIYSAIEDMAPGFGTQWGSWQTTWSGSATSSSTQRVNDRTGNRTTTGTVTTTTTTTTSNQVRTGTQTTLGTERIESGLGEYVTDVNLSYFMRAVSIAVQGEGLRPNRDYHIFFDEDNVNNRVVPAAGFGAVSEGVVRTNADGVVRFTLNIPNGVYRTGERTISIIDDKQKNKDNATSYAEYIFTSSGLQTTVRETVISTRTPTVDTRTITSSRTVVNSSTRTSSNLRTSWERDTDGNGGSDPLAQTFAVSAQAYPHGIFLTSATVYLRNKPTANIPLQVQLRTVTNGYPDSSNIIPFSNVFVPQASCKIPPVTDDLAVILSNGTDVPFEAPVYLEPGKEYALVMLSVSTEYEAYIAVMGQTIFGTDQVITSQISLGSMFKSQNSSTWTAFQNEDLMMKLNKAVFVTNTEGVAQFNAAYEKPVYISEFTHNFEPINFSNITSIEAEYSAKDSLTLVQGEFKPYTLKFNTVPASEKSITSATDFVSRMKLKTTHKDVSPFLDLSRNSVISVHNQINDLGLLNSGFAITNPGSGYTGTPSVTISGGNGIGATATVETSGGLITGITLSNPGSGYTSEPVVTISGGNGTGATVVYKGFETDASGGNALARYITRNVMLEDGFETDYLNVKFDVNKPFGTDVKVYYRAKSPDDSEIIEGKKWVLMKPATDKLVVSGNESQFTEVEYVPTTSTIEYTSNGYTFTKANVVAVKIVMTSGNTSVVPKIKNLRVVTSVT